MVLTVGHHNTDRTDPEITFVANRPVLVDPLLFFFFSLTFTSFESVLVYEVMGFSCEGL